MRFLRLPLSSLDSDETDDDPLIDEVNSFSKYSLALAKDSFVIAFKPFNDGISETLRLEPRFFNVFADPFFDLLLVPETLLALLRLNARLFDVLAFLFLGLFRILTVEFGDACRLETRVFTVVGVLFLDLLRERETLRFRLETRFFGVFAVIFLDLLRGAEAVGLRLGRCFFVFFAVRFLDLVLDRETLRTLLFLDVVFFAVFFLDLLRVDPLCFCPVAVLFLRERLACLAERLLLLDSLVFDVLRAVFFILPDRRLYAFGRDM